MAESESLEPPENPESIENFCVSYNREKGARVVGFLGRKWKQFSGSDDVIFRGEAALSTLADTAKITTQKEFSEVVEVFRQLAAKQEPGSREQMTVLEYIERVQQRFLASEPSRPGSGRRRSESPAKPHFPETEEEILSYTRFLTQRLNSAAVGVADPIRKNELFRAIFIDELEKFRMDFPPVHQESPEIKAAYTQKLKVLCEIGVQASKLPGLRKVYIPFLTSKIDEVSKRLCEKCQFCIERSQDYTKELDEFLRWQVFAIEYLEDISEQATGEVATNIRLHLIRWSALRIETSPFSGSAPPIHEYYPHDMSILRKQEGMPPSLQILCLEILMHLADGWKAYGDQEEYVRLLGETMKANGKEMSSYEAEPLLLFLEVAFRHKTIPFAQGEHTINMEMQTILEAEQERGRDERLLTEVIAHRLGIHPTDDLLKDLVKKSKDVSIGPGNLLYDMAQAFAFLSAPEVCFLGPPDFRTISDISRDFASACQRIGSAYEMSGAVEREPIKKLLVNMLKSIQKGSRDTDPLTSCVNKLRLAEFRREFVEGWKISF